MFLSTAPALGSRSLCVTGWIKAPNDSRSSSLGPVNVTSFWKGALADVAKDLEVRRSSWLIQVGPKCNRQCLHKRQTDRDSAQAHSQARRPCEGRAEKGLPFLMSESGMEWCSHLPRNASSPRNARPDQARSRFSPRASGHLAFSPEIPNVEFWPPERSEEKFLLF